jgi:hypothetical protein
LSNCMEAARPRERQLTGIDKDTDAVVRQLLLTDAQRYGRRGGEGRGKVKAQER